MNPTAELNLKNKILEENRRIHALENNLYFKRHPEQVNGYQTRILEDTLETFHRLVGNPQANILELGCGAGYLYLRLLAHGYFMTGVDLSEEMIRVLERETPARLKGRSNLAVMDIMEFAYRDQNLYDAVVLSALLHHLFDYETIVRKYCAKIKTGGLFLICFEPLKQEAPSPARYALHRGLARLDEFFYRRKMKNEGVPLFEDDYEYADYQRKFGGIDPNRLAAIMESEGMAVVELKKYCARRSAAAAWAANRILHSENTFNLLARKTGSLP